MYAALVRTFALELLLLPTRAGRPAILFAFVAWPLKPNQSDCQQSIDENLSTQITIKYWLLCKSIIITLCKAASGSDIINNL
jgi:hypothetical protein